MQFKLAKIHALVLLTFYSFFHLSPSLVLLDEGILRPLYYSTDFTRAIRLLADFKKLDLYVANDWNLKVRGQSQPQSQPSKQSQSQLKIGQRTNEIGGITTAHIQNHLTSNSLPSSNLKPSGATKSPPSFSSSSSSSCNARTRMLFKITPIQLPLSVGNNAEANSMMLMGSVSSTSSDDELSSAASSTPSISSTRQRFLLSSSSSSSVSSLDSLASVSEFPTPPRVLSMTLTEKLALKAQQALIPCKFAEMNQCTRKACPFKHEHKVNTQEEAKVDTQGELQHQRQQPPPQLTISPDGLASETSSTSSSSSSSSSSSPFSVALTSSSSSRGRRPSTPYHFPVSPSYWSPPRPPTPRRPLKREAIQNQRHISTSGKRTRTRRRLKTNKPTASKIESTTDDGTTDSSESTSSPLWSSSSASSSSSQSPQVALASSDSLSAFSHAALPKPATDLAPLTLPPRSIEPYSYFAHEFNNQLAQHPHANIQSTGQSRPFSPSPSPCISLSQSSTSFFSIHNIFQFGLPVLDIIRD